MIKHKPWVTSTKNVLLCDWIDEDFDWDLIDQEVDRDDPNYQYYVVYKKWIFEQKKIVGIQRLDDSILNAFDLLEVEIEEIDEWLEEEEIEDDDCGLFEFAKGKSDKVLDSSIHEKLENDVWKNAATEYFGKFSHNEIKELQSWLDAQIKTTQIAQEPNNINLSSFNSGLPSNGSAKLL